MFKVVTRVLKYMLLSARHDEVLRHPVFYCRPILHKYANEDVSLGSWFIGLEVEHIDERNMCCGTPPGTVFRTKM